LLVIVTLLNSQTLRRRLLHSSEALARLLSGPTLCVAGLALLLVTALPVVNLLGRQLLGLSWPGLYELGGEIFFVLVMLSFGYTYVRDGHVRVDILRERMSARWVAGIELFACLAIVIPVCGYLVVYGSESAWLALEQGEREAATDLPLQWVVRAAEPLGFLSLLLAGLVVAMRSALALMKARVPPAGGTK